MKLITCIINWRFDLLSYFILYFDSVVSGALYYKMHQLFSWYIHSIYNPLRNWYSSYLTTACRWVVSALSGNLSFFLSFFTGNYVHGVFISGGFWPRTGFRKRQISREVRLVHDGFRHWLGSGPIGVLGLPVQLDGERLDSCDELAFWLVT